MTPPTPVHVTMEAIDSASLVALDRWRQDRKAREGLGAWLVRRSRTALDAGDGTVLPSGCRRFVSHGLAFVFDLRREPAALVAIAVRDLANHRRGGAAPANARRPADDDFDETRWEDYV